MKAYLITTGTLFGIITIAHIWRMFVESNMAREPFYLILTLIAAALSLWAWRLLKRYPKNA